MQLDARKGVASEDWDNFVRESPDALIFHRRSWLEVLHDTQDGELQRYGFLSHEDSECLMGVMPVFVRRFGPFRVAGSPLVVEDTPYMGPAIPPELLPDAMTLICYELRNRVSFLRVLLPYKIVGSARDSLSSAGFTVLTKKTHRLDLSAGTTQIWEQMEGRCRTAVRKARKSGVEVKLVTRGDDDMIRRYYDLVEQVYAAQGRTTPNSLRFYERLWGDLNSSGLLSLAVARVDGEHIAGALFAHDDDCMYYLDGASDYSYRKLNATNLILWKAVEWAAETERSQFDFVGSDIPRLARFKASFGGELVEHSCLEWSRSKYVQRARDWYGRVGKVLFAKLRQKSPIRW